MDMTTQLLQDMIRFSAGDPRRIHHMVKMLSFANMIADAEGLGGKELTCLQAAAILFDCGYKQSQQIYQDMSGKHLEELSPMIARAMLAKHGLDPQIIDHICELLETSHTYRDVEGLDHQILIEADFLVDFFDDNCAEIAIRKALKNVFRTETGKTLCRTIYNIEEDSAAEHLI